MGDDLAAVMLPVFITGASLFACRPEEKNWDYLDQIWTAYEKAEALDVTVLPAAQVRERMIRDARERGTVPD